jgi:hypothetical protein
MDSSYGTLDTKAPLILLAIGIAFDGVSLLFYLYSIIIMLVKKTPPLNILRIAFLTGIPAAILLLISSAKITAFADKMTGATDISAGVTMGLLCGFVVSHGLYMGCCGRQYWGSLYDRWCTTSPAVAYPDTPIVSRQFETIRQGIKEVSAGYSGFSDCSAFVALLGKPSDLFWF